MNTDHICPSSMSDDYAYPLTPCPHDKCAWRDEDSHPCAVRMMAKVMKKRK